MTDIIQDDTVESFTLTLESAGGDQVDITVEYPKGNALLGLYALDTVSKDREKYILTIMKGLEDDPSIAAMLAARGKTIVDEEEDEF